MLRSAAVASKALHYKASEHFKNMWITCLTPTPPPPPSWNELSYRPMQIGLHVCWISYTCKQFLPLEILSWGVGTSRPELLISWWRYQIVLSSRDNWLATLPNLKPDNNHHLGRNSGPKCQQKHVRVYVRVCMHRKVLVAWPGSWPWRRGHIINNCGKVLDGDLACSNIVSAALLIINFKMLNLGSDLTYSIRLR
jgi:hypothetical protein